MNTRASPFAVDTDTERKYMENTKLTEENKSDLFAV
jgi:hypothetical protein